MKKKQKSVKQNRPVYIGNELPNTRRGQQHATEKGTESAVKKEVAQRCTRRSTPRSTSSTPTSLYDFIEESPVSENNKIPSGNRSDKPDKKSLKSGPKDAVKRKPVKASQRTKPALAQSTPKGGVFIAPAVKMQVTVEIHEHKPLSKRIRALKPIPPPNLDDISPIVKDNKSSTPSRKRLASNKTEQCKAENKKLRSSKDSPYSVTPTVSFIESADAAGANDSAIFMSPRKTMPRFSTGKTSTPAEVPVKTKKAAVAKVTKLKARETSTPRSVELKPKYTKMKENVPEISPVHRSDTPTSDYASMDSISTPSPAEKGGRKKRGNSPAFTLEDDDSGEMLNLNKSVDKSYKRSRKKITSQTSRVSSSKLEEWAEKVNSELEDIEQFELSVEG